MSDWVRHYLFLKSFKETTLTVEEAAMAESFLLARLGNCNILFHNIPPFAKTQLQKVQNTTLAFPLIFMPKSSMF